jgi:Domain of unknown function (DUF1902)
MQKLPIDIIAEWDPEASLWVATSEDIAGFVMEDETLERLADRVPDVLKDLIEVSAVELPPEATEISYEIHASVFGSLVRERLRA